MKPKKKRMATQLWPMSRLLPEPVDHRVVVPVRPADVDAREEEAGEDDADAEEDAERDVAGGLRAEEVALERDEEDEAVVDDQRRDREVDRDGVLAGDEVLEVGVVEELKISPVRFTHRGGILPKAPPAAPALRGAGFPGRRRRHVVVVGVVDRKRRRGERPAPGAVMTVV